MGEEAALTALADVLAREVGFASRLEAPAAINGLLLRTHPSSPIFDPDKIGFLNRFFTKLTGSALPEGFQFTAKELHHTVQQLAKGAAYVCKRFNPAPMDGHLIAAQIQLPQGMAKNFQAAVVHNPANGMNALCISPHYLLDTMIASKMRLPRNIPIAGHPEGHLFNAAEDMLLTGVEETFHAHQYATGQFPAERILDPHAQSAAYRDSPWEKAAQDVVKKAAQELGLGSVYSGRRK